MASRLKNVVVKFVSLVDAGAGVGANVALFKRDEKKSADPELVDVLSKMQPGTGDVHINVPLGSKGKKSKKKNKKKGDVTKSGAASRTLTRQRTTEDKIVAKNKTTETETDLTKMSTTDLIKYAEGLEAIVVEQASEIAKHDDEGDDELIAKLDPETVERIEKAEKRAERAEKVAKAERAARLAKRFDDEADTLVGIPVEKAELSTLLSQLHEADEDLYKSTSKVLRKASAAAEKGLFSEVGKSSAATTVSASIEKRAEALRAKDPSLSPQQAVAKALEDNPELYAEHQASKTNGGN